MCKIDKKGKLKCVAYEQIIYNCVNLFIESGALVMIVVVVLWFNVPVNIYGHVETVS